MPSSTFATQKIDRLKQCIRITEDLLSSISDETKLLDFLDQRSDVLQQLEESEKAVTAAERASCSESDIAKIDQLVALLLQLDAQAVTSIKAELQDTLSAMKANVNEHKFIGYKGDSDSPTGNFLDAKR